MDNESRIIFILNVIWQIIKWSIIIVVGIVYLIFKFIYELSER